MEANKTGSGKSKNEKQSTKETTCKVDSKFPSYLEKEVKLKRQVSLLSGVSIIIGSIIGSGIFISPKGVLQYSGSAPLSIIVWTACGVISLFGALSFAELGTLIPLSGGDYIYLLKGFETLGSFGKLPSFLFMWTQMIALSPSSAAILSLTVAEYTVEPFYPNCPPPLILKKLVAILCVCSGAFINCVSVKLTTCFNNFFTAAKLTALLIIIIGGIILVIRDDIAIGTLTNFEGSSSSVSDIATAVYFGMWAYGGWNSLNNLTEELIEPEKNILRAIIISLPIVTVCYIMTNIAYLMAMSPEELLSSEAVALLFANNVLGVAAPFVPILVAASAYGCSIVSCLGTARLAFVAAREGHLLSILSYIHIHNFTPVPAVLFNTFLGIIYISLGNFDTLINFLSFAAWMFFGLCMVALIYMRWSKKDEPRSYKVPLPFPIIMLLAACYLVFCPIIQSPRLEYLYAVVFILSGLIFYIPFVHYKIHLNCIDKVTIYLQLLLQVAPTDEPFKDGLSTTKL